MNSQTRNRVFLVSLLFIGLMIAGIVNAQGLTASNTPVSETATQGFLTGPQAGDALDIALNYLRANKETYGLTEADLADVQVSRRYVSQHTGVTHIYLVQRLNGVEVFNGVININVMSDGRILSIGNRFVSDLSGNVKNTAPSISAIAAVEAAAHHLNLDITEPLTTLSAASGADQATVLSKGGISQNDIEVKLVYDASGKDVRLAWNAIIYQNDSLHWWNIRVDANTGEILSQNDWVVHDNWGEVEASHNHAATNTTANEEVAFGPTPVADGSSYQVFQIPIESPIHSSPPSPADGRTIQAQPADAVGSPFGWHDTNGAAGAESTLTIGNNAQAYLDLGNDNTPTIPGDFPADGGAGLDFLFALDLTLAPSGYRPAAVTNLFYWNNLMHDVPYRYGFDSASGNFQENTYGLGGIGSDSVNAEAQDGGGTNNANFATPADGSNPRMQMYLWSLTTPGRDGDLDNGIIAHEYGHGISNRLTGDSVNCLNNAEQMGEGWSDWQSVMLTMRTGDTGPQGRGVGTYALGQPTTGPGIRPAPYSTDMGVNGYTYGDLPGMAVPHGVGFVWNTMLWEMNWALIDVYGFNEDIYRPSVGSLSGNQLAYQLVMDGMKIQPCSPGFVDGRDAILAADVALTGGVNQCTIWAAFAKRGLGFSASQGVSTSTSDGTEAFDLPNACLTLDVTPLSQSICQGQTATYTVSVGSSFTPPVNMSASGNPAPTTAVFTPNPVPSVPSTTDLTIGNTGTAPVGTHTITILADDGTITDTADVDLTIYAGAPGSAPTLVSPPDGATGVATAPSLTWNAVSGATNYYVEIADDAGFTNIVYTADEPTTTHLVAASLAPDTTHYWRVTAENPCGSSAASAPFSFTTVNVICRTPALPLPDDPDVSDTMTVAANGTLLDLNVSINANHSWVGDTIFTLQHVDTGTTVTMIDRPGRTTTGFGCANNNIDVELDDEGVDGPVENQCAVDPALFGNPTPNNPLTAFDGQDLSGTWTLLFSDAAGGDTGVLNEWCLIPVTQAAGYSIELTKTVGTDPNTCATTDSVTLPPGGGDVTYCYTVTNTGQSALNVHTLVDDQLGTILNNFPFNLTAGASAFVTVTTSIVTDTVNVATWTASDGSTSVSDTDSASVTVQYYLPDIATDSSVTSSQATNTVVTQTLQIANLGEVTGTIPFIGGGNGDLVWQIQEAAALTAPNQAVPILGGLPASSTDGNAAETVADSATDGAAPAAPKTLVPYVPQGDVLYDNGPLVNSPGTGSGGADESMLQTNLTMNILGFGHQTTANNSMADDFVIPTGEQWTIDTITFYAYQTGSTTTSTITGMNVDIYDGDPSSGGTVIASSSTMLSSQWANIYRVTNTTSGNTQRPIMATVMDLGSLALGEGTYWIEWQASGSLASGPWAPPITINGQTTTGNGLQNLAGVWGAAMDVGQQGLPFVINGSSISAGCGNDIPWLSVSPASGTTAVFNTSDVDVTFDSTGLATGTYTGTLCVISNDSDEPLVTVPVTLTVEAVVYGVNLSGDDTASGNPGTTVTYTLQVTNTGNAADTYDLAVSGNVWTTTLSDSSVTLNPGESANFTAAVDIPGGAGNGDTDTANVVATSQSDGSVTDSADLTTTAVVGAIYGVDLSGDEATSGLVGTTVTYTLEITNTGNVVDTYDLAASGNAWTTTLSDSSITLNPGESTSFTAAVDIPGGAGDGDTDTATITATSQSNGSATDSADLITTAVVGAVYGVDLSADDAASGDAGTTVTYTVQITNAGNVADTFDLVITGNVWTTTLSISDVTLNAGDSTSFTVVVEIPAGAGNGDTDTVTVTATSQSDGTATDSADLTTTAVVPPPPTYMLYLPVVAKP